jgi:tetratricopeptide (TPR) repeat protein
LQPPLAALWSDGNFYLFDPLLGLPIPGPPAADGKPTTVATLAEILADDSLLRRLDLDSEHPYRLTTSELEGAVALVEASPLALSRRMKLVESHLAGDQKIALAADATALAESIKQAAQVSDVRIWDYPYRTRAAALAVDPEAREAAIAELRTFVWRPSLWKARVLHFQGSFDGDESAKKYYRTTRPSNDRIEKSRIHPEEKRLVEEAKMHASYWLGLLLYEQQHYDNAANYFDRFTLRATPDGPWTLGARYNLARAYEAQGLTDKAIALYESDTSPQSHGNRLRARRLRQAAP